MSTPEVKPSPREKDIDNYHKVELEEIFEKTRTLLSLRIQIFSVIGTAHLTIIGIAFTTQKGILIFLAAGLMGLLIQIDSMIKPILDVVCARGLQIEKIYSNDNDALCVSIILATFRNRRKSYVLASKIREANTQDELIQLIRPRSSNTIGVWFPILVAFLDCVGGIFLWKFKLLPII